MAKRIRTEQQITKVAGQGNYLQQYVEEDKSLKTVQEHVVLPRMKIIQGQTDNELKQAFPEGSVIIRPGDAKVWGPDDQPFLFVPLFFHVEWNKWSDYKDKESPSIVEGPVFDPTHLLAKMAANRDKRTELYAGHESKPVKQQWFYSYVQHFCWTGIIYGEHDFAGTECVLGMERGEFGNGRQFINAISMRRIDLGERRVPQPLWSQVWSMQPSLRQGKQGNWYGFDFNPADNPVIDESDAESLRARHLELARLFEENRLRVDQTEGDQGVEREGEGDGEEATDAKY